MHFKSKVREPASLEPCPESPSLNRSPGAKALQLLLLTTVGKGARHRGLLLRPRAKACRGCAGEEPERGAGLQAEPRTACPAPCTAAADTC